MSWILVPCLVSLRDEFNQLARGRDKASDGSKGDDAHAERDSDHNPDETGATATKDADKINEVHAVDVDADLRRPGWTMQRAVDIIVARHRAGRDDRLQNVIYNRRIWSASWGWNSRPYTGSNPHDKHAHFSSRYTTGEESDTRPWGLLEEDDDMPLSKDDLAAVREQARLGFVDALAQGNDSALGRAPAGEAGKPGRFIRDSLRNLVGGPVDQAAILAKIAALDNVDEAALAAALGPVLVPPLQAAIREMGGDLSAETVEAALRNVLRAGVGA